MFYDFNYSKYDIINSNAFVQNILGIENLRRDVGKLVDTFGGHDVLGMFFVTYLQII